MKRLLFLVIVLLVGCGSNDAVFEPTEQIQCPKPSVCLDQSCTYWYDHYTHQWHSRCRCLDKW